MRRWMGSHPLVNPRAWEPDRGRLTPLRGRTPHVSISLRPADPWPDCNDRRESPGGSGSVAALPKLAHALAGTPATEFPGTVTRQFGQQADDELNTESMIGFRRSPQGCRAQSIPNDRITLAAAWLQRSRTRRTGVGVDTRGCTDRRTLNPVTRLKNPITQCPTGREAAVVSQVPVT